MEIRVHRTSEKAVESLAFTVSSNLEDKVEEFERAANNDKLNLFQLIGIIQESGRINHGRINC